MKCEVMVHSNGMTDDRVYIYDKQLIWDSYEESFILPHKSKKQWIESMTHQKDVNGVDYFTFTVECDDLTNVLDCLYEEYPELAL